MQYEHGEIEPHLLLGRRPYWQRLYHFPTYARRFVEDEAQPIVLHTPPAGVDDYWASYVVLPYEVEGD
jgi:hypothetical protein